MAITLSLFVHAVLLFAPHIHLSPPAIFLPLLTVRLEAARQVVPPAESIALQSSNSKPEVKERLTIKKVAPGKLEQKSIKDMAQPEKTEPDVLSVDKETMQNEFEPQLLKPVQLMFAIYNAAGIKTGEASYKLEINRQHYVLTAVLETTGVADIAKNYQLIQTSRGSIGATGFKPEQFSEEINDINGKQSLNASFNWEKNKLTLAGGDNADLLAQTQDALSFLYQFSQVPLDGEIVPLPVSDGNALEDSGFEVSRREKIDTNLGELDTVKVRKIHVDGQSWVEVWLGLGYQLLPVKIRQVDETGKTVSEMAISAVITGDER